MKTVKVQIAVILFVSLTMIISPGCSGVRAYPIYTSALGGALVGAIIGHQSNEGGEVAMLGAAIAATGCLLQQLDEANEEKGKEEKCKEEKIAVEVTNRNGWITPVVLKKKSGIYFGPNGTQFDKLPTEEQLRITYGL